MLYTKKEDKMHGRRQPWHDTACEQKVNKALEKDAKEKQLIMDVFFSVI